jgi:hypothetical protein
MSENEFNPLQWPPDIELARLHYECSKAGLDNTEGKRCPCCQRLEKISNNRWACRDITRDFKKYGGGIPGYFYLVIYLMVTFVILCGVKVVYHIMLLEQTCPTLEGTKERCALLFGIFWNCDNSILYNQLVALGKQDQADTLEYLQLATYIILVIGTLGIKLFLHIIGKGTVLDEKLFSTFALIIKNVPLYYQLEDLKNELGKIVPDVNIAEVLHFLFRCSIFTRPVSMKLA